MALVSDETQDDPCSNVNSNGVEAGSGSEYSSQDGPNGAYRDADQAQYDYAPPSNAAAYGEGDLGNNDLHGGGYAQCSEGSIDNGPMEGSAEGPEAEELERDEHYTPGFTDSELSIPYTWLLNGA